LTFRTLLELIGWQVQTRLDERVIKHAVLFAPCHKGEASQVSEHGPGAILSVKPEQVALRRKLVGRKVARDRGKSLAQFRSVEPVASVAKRAEPLETVVCWLLWTSVREQGRKTRGASSSRQMIQRRCVLTMLFCSSTNDAADRLE
jgi:hypothetical protein